jgi:hypothetical protein
MPWGEEVTVLMELGFPVNGMKLDDPELAALDTAILDGTLIGDDVSSYCQNIRINRGRPDQLQNFNSGTCVIDLNNNDRRFDPINQSSPYWDAAQGRSGVTPRRKVTVQSDGVDLFVGLITDIDVSYAPTRSGAAYDLSTVQITAADDFVLLANTYIENPITPSEELSGTRVEAILDLPEVAYPLASRNIDAGITTLGGGATFEITANTNVLSYLQDVATAEQGYFFVGANGDLVFTDRVGATFGGAEASFSDDGTALPYSTLEVVYGQEFLYNKVITSIIGGTEQVADDAASQTEFGISTLSLDGLLLSTDAAALELAQDLLGKYSQPQYRFDRMRTEYMTLTGGQQTSVSNLELGDIVEITRNYNTGTPSSVSFEFSIEAISHTITASGHSVEFGLAYAELLNPFTLNDATFGTLDENNALSEEALLPFFFDISEFDSGFSFQ